MIQKYSTHSQKSVSSYTKQHILYS
jgi:hypothetical protein